METNLTNIFKVGILDGIKSSIFYFWPYSLILALFVVGKLAYLALKLYRLSKAGMFEIDKMEGSTFEIYLSTLFQRLGYRVNRVGSSHGDYGADLVVEKDGIKTVVQAKRYTGVVGINSVREASGAVNFYHCNNSMVVTNSYFTKQAINLANANNVVLWDRYQLAQKILNS